MSSPSGSCFVGVIGLVADKPLATKLQEATGEADCLDVTGYTKTVRELMRGKRKHRGSSVEVRSALQRLVDTGLGHWEENARKPDGGRKLRVSCCREVILRRDRVSA